MLFLLLIRHLFQDVLELGIHRGFLRGLHNFRFWYAEVVIRLILIEKLFRLSERSKCSFLLQLFRFLGFSFSTTTIFIIFIICIKVLIHIEVGVFEPTTGSSATLSGIGGVIAELADEDLFQFLCLCHHSLDKC